MTDGHEVSLQNTGHTQKNGAVPRAIENFISYPTRAQHTLPSVSKFLMLYQQFASHAYCGPQEKAFCVRFMVSRYVITVQREFRAWFKKMDLTRIMSFLNRALTDLDTSKRSIHEAFSYRDAILEIGPAVPQ
jgi:hypothetical protein